MATSVNPTTTIQGKNITPFVAGCGTRRQGKAYLYSDMQRYLEQYPFSYFIFDPPIVIDPKEWGLAPISLNYVFNDGHWHVVDWVGESHYPNAADILEEAFLHNGSTLTPLEHELEKLTPGHSRRLLVHPKGYVHNANLMKQDRLKVTRVPECFLEEGDYRKMHVDHMSSQMCAALHWQNIRDKEEKYRKIINRHIGDTAYEAATVAPEWDLQYSPAIIGWLPIDEIHLIEGPDKTAEDKAIEFLQEFSGLPIYLTNA